jgi:hypothetical protein
MFAENIRDYYAKLLDVIRRVQPAVETALQLGEE